MQENLNIALKLIPIELLNTLYMVFASSILSLLFGLPLGIILNVTSKGQFAENLKVYKFLSFFINIGRSFPFAILIVALIPFTRFITGTSLGTTASIVPLTIAAIPFVARVVELALMEVDKQIIDAARVMGSNSFQIITKVLLKESKASLILGFTNIVINLIGYSAMAGLMGGGGLGKIAIQYGYYQFNTFLMISTVITLILLVQLIQFFGTKVAQNIYKKLGKISEQ
jgi:D-methionine transport system permease protein